VFRNILVSVDGSSHSYRALEEAIDLADSNRARLTVLTAIPKPPGWICTPMTACAAKQLELDFEREARETLCAAVDRVPPDTPVTKILSRDSIREALRRAAKSGRYDLFVIGAGGPPARAGARRGTAGRYVLDHCDVPVLIVHDDRNRAIDADERRDALSAPAAHVHPSHPLIARS